MANTKQTRQSPSQTKTPKGDQQRTAQKQSGFSALSQQWDKN